MNAPKVFILDGNPAPKPSADAGGKDAARPSVSGKPFLRWQQEWLARQGIRDVFFVSDRRYSDLPEYRNGSSKADIPIQCCNFDELTGKGTGGMEFLKGASERECLFIESSVLFDIPLDWLANYRRTALPAGSICIALRYSEDTRGMRRFSVGLDWAVSHSSGEMNPGRDGYVYGGILAVGADSVRDIGIYRISCGDAWLPELIREGRLFGVPFGGKHLDIGREDVTHSPASSVLDRVFREKAPALFLDRDGILVEDTGYVRDPDTLVFKESFFELSRMAQDKGFLIVILSNQAGVAKGLMTVGDVERVNARIGEEFSRYGVRPAAMYWCPYHQDGVIPEWTRFSLLRKPEPGMALKAMEEHAIDPLKSIMIGDRNTDRIRLPYLRTFLVSQHYPADNLGDVVDVKRIEEIIRSY